MFVQSIRKSFTMLAVCLLCLCLFSVVAAAQSTTQGAIAGTIVDATGAVVAKAAVTLHIL
jgi:hypothetical protein